MLVELISSQVLKLCAETGLVKVGLVAVYGTKLKANDSLSANRNYNSIEQEAAAEQEKKISQRDKEEKEIGYKKRGRKLKPADKKVSQDEKANITDPESRIMKTRSGFVQGYNAQAVVTKEQIIIAADITQEENDVRQLHPMLDQAQHELSAAGVEEKIAVAVEDAGYWCEENIRNADLEGLEILIATTKNWKQRKASC